MNSTLYNAAKSYVEAAMELLASTNPKLTPQTLDGFTGWSRSDTVFVLRNRQLPFYCHEYFEYRKLVHGLAEYQVYIQALRTEPYASRHIGLVSTSRGGRTIEIEELADSVLWQLADKLQAFGFDEAEFESIFKEFEADLERDYAEITAIAPLPGLKFDGPSDLPRAEF